MMHTNETEPPSWSRPPLFMIGQDEQGHWVAQELNGVCGGLFVNRDAALRYVRSENGRRPQAVVMVSGILELDMKQKPVGAARSESSADPQLLRRIA
jgi:hypothetical protein